MKESRPTKAEKLMKIKQLVMQNEEYFLDGIDGDILQIINA